MITCWNYLRLISNDPLLASSIILGCNCPSPVKCRTYLCPLKYNNDWMTYNRGCNNSLLRETAYPSNSEMLKRKQTHQDPRLHLHLPLPPCQQLRCLRSNSHHTWPVSTHLHPYNSIATTKLRHCFSENNGGLIIWRSQTLDCWMTHFILQYLRTALALLPSIKLHNQLNFTRMPKDIAIVLTQVQHVIIGNLNEICERYVFNSRNQCEDETIDTFITELRIRTKSCRFRECVADSILRDQIVMGVKCVETRKKLISTKKLTLSMAEQQEPQFISWKVLARMWKYMRSGWRTQELNCSRNLNLNTTHWHLQWKNVNSLGRCMKWRSLYVPHMADPAPSAKDRAISLWNALRKRSLYIFKLKLKLKHLIGQPWKAALPKYKHITNAHIDTKRKWNENTAMTITFSGSMLSTHQTLSKLMMWNGTLMEPFGMRRLVLKNSRT